MNIRKTSQIFICRFSDRVLQVAKAPASGKDRGTLSGLEEIRLTLPADDAQLSGNVRAAFERLGYCGNPVLVVFPRNQATCRYLRVPGASAQELEKIVAMQSGRFLPYPAQELVSGYQLAATEPDNYFGLSVAIVHKNAIQRFLNFFEGMRPARVNVILSSYGLCSLYHRLKPQQALPLMLVDIDDAEAELAIVRSGKLLFSAAFKCDCTRPNWDIAVRNEIVRSRDAFLREVPGQAPEKIVIFANGKVSAQLAVSMNRAPYPKVEILTYNPGFKAAYSLAALAGFAGARFEESLELLPPETKARALAVDARHRRFKAACALSAACLVFIVGSFVHMQNKGRYLALLKEELRASGQQAGPLEEMERRLRSLENKEAAGPAIPAMIAELHRLSPDDITLASLTFENNQLTLRGRAGQLKSVFSLTTKLGESTVLQGFSSKVRYATKQKTQQGEAVDFEICSLKEKK